MQLEFHLIHPRQAHQDTTCHITKTMANQNMLLHSSFCFFLNDLKPKPLCMRIVAFDLHTSCKFLKHDAHKKMHLLMVSYLSNLQPNGTLIPSNPSPSNTPRIIFFYTKIYIIKICYFIPSHLIFSLYDLKPKPLCKRVVTSNLHTSCNFLEHEAHKKNICC
jgi:hypothetical protein